MGATVAKKVLVIDDDPAFVRLVEQGLTPAGFEVLTAASGGEGLRLLFANRPDIVLLDVVMPEMALTANKAANIPIRRFKRHLFMSPILPPPLLSIYLLQA